MRTEKTQISKIRNAKGEVTINTTEIIRDYFENQHSNKLENLEVIDRFVDIYYHPKLNHEDINYLNGSITQNETEAAIKSLQKKKSPGHNVFFAEYYPTFKELIPTILKVLHEMERGGKLLN
jgi:hypothetical protein